MAKEIIYGADAKNVIKEGIDAVANAVKVTLGPKGQTVLLDDQFNDKITKDGVSVARSIELKDKVKNAGAKLVKKTCSKTAEDCGDGTTTSAVLAQSIVNHGTKLIAAGINPMEMKKGIDLAVKDAIEYFKSASIPVEGEEELKKIATVSANGDETIGDLVGNVTSQVGPEGVVTIETSKSLETYIEKVKGLRFDRGYVSQYFITDPDTMTAQLDNPYILITDTRISTIKSLESILNYVASQGRSLLIISDGVDGEALQMLVVNKLRGTLKVAAVKCPAFGDRRLQELEDIAAVVGGVVVSEDKGMSLVAVSPEVLGTAAKVSIDAKNCTIIDGKGNQEVIDQRIEIIKKGIEEETSSYNKSAYQTRLAKLTGGVAVLYVGAISEVELNERKDRIDDALCATRAANEEGTMPGGGIAYLNASVILENNVVNGSEDMKAGYSLIINALRSPLHQIVTNGQGSDEAGYVVRHVRGEKMGLEGLENPDFGYNAREDKYGNLRQMGIIDPTKVCRTALENAASISSMYLTTGCIIIDEPEDKKEEN